MDVITYAKFGHLLGAALVVGGAVFQRLIWQPDAADPDRPDLDAAARRAIGGVVGAGALLLLAAGVVDLLRLGSALSAAPLFSAATVREAWTVVSITDIGKWMLLRALAGLPVWAAVRWLPRNRWMSTALSMPLILLMSLLAHQGEVAVAAALTAIHMAMTAAWYGGLVALFLLPWQQMDGHRASLVVNRFSRLGLIAMAALGLTGICLASLRMYGWSALTEHPYGVALQNKLWFLLGVLALAAVNRWVFQPRLPAGGAVLTRFRWFVGIEVLLGLAVLVSAAILSTTPAARVEPVRLTAYLRDGQIDPPVLEVPRNRLVRLVVINEGTSRHAFVAYQFPHDMEGGDHQHGDAADMVVVVEPGAQEVLLFTPRRQGEYLVYCAIDDHQHRGETARLIVR